MRGKSPGQDTAPCRGRSPAAPCTRIEVPAQAGHQDLGDTEDITRMHKEGLSFFLLLGPVHGFR